MRKTGFTMYQRTPRKPVLLKTHVEAWEDLALNRPSWRGLVSRGPKSADKRCRATDEHGKRVLLQLAPLPNHSGAQNAQSAKDSSAPSSA
ncbi:hypothetical protein ACROYT_G005598 [Oculina patagonica]